MSIKRTCERCGVKYEAEDTIIRCCGITEGKLCGGAVLPLQEVEEPKGGCFKCLGEGEVELLDGGRIACPNGCRRKS